MYPSVFCFPYAIVVAFMPTRFRFSVLSILFLVVMGVGLLGCSGPSVTTSPTVLPEEFPNHSAEDIRALIGASTDTLQQFSADARVRVQSPQENRSFNASIHQRRADSLLMRFSLFGVEGGRMLLTPDSVFMYDSRNHTLKVGPVAEAQKLLPAPVESDQVFENMLGLIGPSEDRSWTVTADSSLYYLSSANDRHKWTIDPKRWRPLRYTRTRSDGTVTEERRFANFKSVQGVPLPHQVVFRRPTENLQATINYREIQLNPSTLSLALDVPDGISRSSFP